MIEVQRERGSVVVPLNKISLFNGSNHVILPIKAKGQLKVKLKDIVYFRALRNYAELVLCDGTSVEIKYSLTEIWYLKELVYFERVHRSYFVNLQHIIGFTGGKLPKLYLSNQNIVPLSKHILPFVTQFQFIM